MSEPTPTESKPQRIIRLAVNNIMRISAAEVRPDGNPLVIVAGRNSQGKTSLLDSIAIALSGKNLPAQPIKRGQANASVILETNELIVTRTFSQTGGAKLEVRDRDNNKLTAPQTKLDLLFSQTTFDPLSFANAKPIDQANTVRRIAGLDFAEDDKEYAEVFEERTAIGRDLRAAQARRDQYSRTDAPEREVSVADLAKQLADATENNQSISGLAGKRTAIFQHIDGNAKEIENLEAQLAEAKRRSVVFAEQLIAVDEELKAKQLIDLEAIRGKMQTAEETNVKVRANQAFRNEHDEVIRLQGVQGALTARLEGINKRKQDALAAAKFPIDGLAFNDAGVTFQGIPFEQASSSEKIRVSLAISCALNPNLRVMLIRDGSLLDSDSLKLIGDYAAENDAQVFIEKVADDPEGCTVFIEDGTSYDPKTGSKSRKTDAQKADQSGPQSGLPL